MKGKPPFKFTEYQVERPNGISARVFAPLADAAFAQAVLSWDYTKSRAISRTWV